MADEFVQALDKLVEVSGQLTDLILGLDVDALGQIAIAGDMFEGALDDAQGAE